MTQKSIWTVYFLRCNDNSLYTGITTDTKRRLHQHNNTKLGAKYTRARRPVKLVYSETAADRSTASKREYELRTLTKKQKEKLVLAYPIFIVVA
jgi:putative endonuclease